jgi:glyoxylase-like metal-dependent hydrolase (beta-lactamase superfamily II)
MNSHPITIDCQYVRPKFAAAYLTLEKKSAFFVEANTSHAVPLLLNQLKQAQMTPEQVDYIIITHVHLDHAGGTSALMKACPNAVLLAHPRAAKHMMDPSRLISSARSVYGDETFKNLYGEIEPISPNRIRTLEDEEELHIGTRTLKFLHTRGHANHHFCILDSGSNSIFTGDAFGLAYPALQQRGLFIFPSTSPTDFDPTEAILSIQKIVNSKVESAYLTHFGKIQDLQEAGNQLSAYLEFSEKLMNQAASMQESSDKIEKFCFESLKDHSTHLLEKKGIPVDSDVWSWLEMDIQLNAAGITFSAIKKRKS